MEAQDLPPATSGLSPAQSETLDAVLRAYGPYDGLSLSLLARSEPPWIEARRNSAGEPEEPTAMSDRPIPHEAMTAYYGGL